MKLVSISGLVLRAKDPQASADFYERLGFIVTKREPAVSSLRLNWFWVEFVEADGDHPVLPSSQFIYVGVDDVDKSYQELTAKGFKFALEPQDFPSGRREIMLQDPDGYWVVFFKKK